ncbi:anthranilate phosphoribosyltransferase [bacterium]|nr:anthranilate phosphoribosyltransferase [bacterium]
MRALLDKLLDGVDLTGEEARELMSAIMDGAAAPAQIAAALAALRVKGETVDEIAGFARAMRERVDAVDVSGDKVIDTCGTGGDARGTFNISTATALVAAGMGITVAKHGNRAVSSSCGSADVLEALGVAVDLPPARVAELVDELGIGFMFAPRHHPAMRHAMPVRRELGARTVFNVLGPLTNPAGVRRQLLGVYRPALTVTLARVLGRLGSERAFVVCGYDGVDEVSATGPTHVAELRDGEVREYSFAPELVGLERCSLDDLAGGDPQMNARRVREVLDGASGPCRDAVLLNAGFCAVLAGLTDDPAEGVELAAAAVDGGRARAVLDALVERTRAMAGGAS